MGLENKFSNNNPLDELGTMNRDSDVIISLDRFSGDMFTDVVSSQKVVNLLITDTNLRNGVRKDNF